jgi:hypothetical protein
MDDGCILAPSHPVPKEVRPMPRRPRLVISSLALPVLLAAAARVDAAPVLPSFDPAEFVQGAVIDNLYLPWETGARSAQVGHGVDEDGQPFVERDVQKVLGLGPKIGGVRTTVVRDNGYEDGVLSERTRDYYAQDKRGNVWYLGEDTVALEFDNDGNIIGRDTTGSWRAGRNDARPGYAMPVDLTSGFEYYQEFSPKDGAVDQAKTLSVLDSLTVGDHTYFSVLKVLETTAVEPDAREAKYYAPGIGLIRAEEGLDEELRNPSITFNRVDVAAVPLPPSLLLLAGGLAALAGLRRRRSQRTTTFAPL